MSLRFVLSGVQGFAYLRIEEKLLKALGATVFCLVRYGGGVRQSGESACGRARNRYAAGRAGGVRLIGSVTFKGNDARTQGFRQAERRIKTALTMKYKKTDYKGNSTEFPVKIVEKKVPFRKEGERVMYHLSPTGVGVKDFEDLARGYIRHLGINEYMAGALAGMISDGICHWLDSGYAVNIAKVGTLKPVLKCKAHLDPHDCSVEDVKNINIRFYPCKPINDVLSKIALRVKGRKKFLTAWEEKRKRKNG